MTRTVPGLALSLPALMILGAAAVAQTPPASPPGQKPPAMAPAAPPAAPAPTAPAPKPGDLGSGSPAPNGMAQNGMTQTGPAEGMVIETPNGFYLVRPGESAPRRLDMGPAGPKPGAMAQGQADAAQDGDMPMDDMAAQDGAQPPMEPRPHGPMPPQPEGKGARFRIKTPNLTLGMKCPDDEPIKACVDAVSELIAKTTPPSH